MNLKLCTWRQTFDIEPHPIFLSSHRSSFKTNNEVLYNSVFNCKKKKVGRHCEGKWYFFFAGGWGGDDDDDDCYSKGSLESILLDLKRKIPGQASCRCWQLPWRRMEERESNVSGKEISHRDSERLADPMVETVLGGRNFWRKSTLSH